MAATSLPLPEEKWRTDAGGRLMRQAGETVQRIEERLSNQPESIGDDRVPNGNAAVLFCLVNLPAGPTA